MSKIEEVNKEYEALKAELEKRVQETDHAKACAEEALAMQKQLEHKLECAHAEMAEKDDTIYTQHCENQYMQGVINGMKWTIETMCKSTQ